MHVGHLVAKFATYANGAIWWSNLQLIQVAPNMQPNACHGVNLWVCCASGNVYTVFKNKRLWKAEFAPTL